MFMKKNPRKKRIIFYTGSSILLTGAIVLCANACGNKNEEEKKVEVTTTTTAASTTAPITKEFVTTKATTTTADEVEYIDLDEETTAYDEEGEVMLTAAASNDDEPEYATTIGNQDEVISQLLAVKNAKEDFTMEDVIDRSEAYAKYVNNYSVMSHDKYKFSKFTAEDMYSMVYLTNIDHISTEETAKMIEAGIIADDAPTNIANSFYFCELYIDDTMHKVMEKNGNILDLGLLMGYDADRKTAGTMNNIITGFISNDNEINRKNYLDTVYWYVEGTTVNMNGYSYKDSVYETDRDRLSAGSNYALLNASTCIKELAKMAGVATEQENAYMDTGSLYYEDVINIFNNSCGQPDKSKQYVK